MPAGPPSETVWDSMNNKFESKRSGDLQWRLIHWIVLSKRLTSKSSPPSTCCPFCICTEDVFHAFINCVRLVPLFNWFNFVSHKMNVVFSLHSFIFGFHAKPNKENIFLDFL